MKIALICPAEDNKRVEKPGDKPKTMRISRSNRVSLLAVAAVTPPEFDIRYIDEYVEAVDYSVPCDLVGISFMTALAHRAYAIGDEYRRRGVPVVFGGYHASFLPEEAMQHCDAVCVGEAEPTWPRMLADLQCGQLSGVYRSPERTDLTVVKPLRREILKKRAYATTNVVLAGRGCPKACEFCSVTQFFGHTYRTRPLNDVLDEICSLPGRLLLFCDDNIVADPVYAAALFRALIPLKRKWMSQANLSIADDPELLDLARRSGCIGLFVGLESLSNESLIEAGKGGFYQSERYAALLLRLHRAGIAVSAGFVFGFDHDDQSVFEQVMRFSRQTHLAAAQIAILTPFPGTPLFANLDRAGRILDKNWTHYDFRHVVFEPRKMSATELQAGADWTMQEFYSGASILARLAPLVREWGLAKVLIYGLPLNLSYRRNLGVEQNARHGVETVL